MTKRNVVADLRDSLDAESQARDDAAETIDELLGYLSGGYYDADSTVSRISDGVFQTEYLATYPYCDELVECCGEAIDELAGLPCNPKTRANVMGRAMELLRKRYKVDAPRGWYPVMKELRAMPHDGIDKFQSHGDEDDGVEHQDEDGTDERTGTPGSYDSDDEDSGIVPPEEVLANWQSVLNCSEVDKERELQSLALEKPEIEAAFISLAREYGVPHIYKEGLAFMDLLIGRLETVPDAILSVRARLQHLAQD